MGLCQEQMPSYLMEAVDDATASQVFADYPASVPAADILVAIKQRAVIVEVLAVR